MPTVALSWTDWRRVIVTLRASGISYMLDHANQLEELLEVHGPGEEPVVLSLSDDVYLRSVTWACWHLGLSLLADDSEPPPGGNRWRRE